MSMRLVRLILAELGAAGWMLPSAALTAACAAGIESAAEAVRGPLGSPDAS